jgi:serine/threonine protein kinase
VKPGNLLVTPSGLTKVSDLGLAGWLNDTDTDPRAGKIVGTADYLSPEQILSPTEVTPTSDIYSLGCALYYAVTGKVPFPGGTSREKAKRHLEDTPIHPRRLNPSLSEEFVEIIADMMDKSPERRIQSATEVITRLKPWTSDRVDVAALQSPDQKQPLPPKAAAIPQHETVGDGAEEIVLEPETEWQLEEGLSQASLGTEPFASADQETAASHGDSWIGVRRRKLSIWELLLVPIALIAVLTLLATLISAFIK